MGFHSVIELTLSVSSIITCITHSNNTLFNLACTLEYNLTGYFGSALITGLLLITGSGLKFNLQTIERCCNVVLACSDYWISLIGLQLGNPYIVGHDLSIILNIKLYFQFTDYFKFKLELFDPQLIMSLTK